MRNKNLTIKIFRYCILFVCFFTSTVAFAQVTITGTVIADADQGPLPGVNITVKGTTIGTISDYDGNYTIEVADNEAVLVFSMVGMKDVERPVGNESSINISMEENLVGLDEVVVVGYGTMKKSDLTGSVASVGTDELVKRGTTSVVDAMQGAVAGVSITQGSGRSSGSNDFDIQIRGKSSINSDVTPLYVVDGIIVSDIDFLNPQDIERIDVLKDASSTAIYGSRATAGVVMVTTKSGKSVQGKGDRKPTITYDGFYGLTQVARMPDFMDAQEFADYRFLNFLGSNDKAAQPIYRMSKDAFDQSMLYDGDGHYVLKDMLASGESYDWPSLLTQNGVEQNHFVTVSGSSEYVSYYFGAGYNSSTGTYQGDEKERFNIKGSIDSKINKYVSSGMNFNLAYTKQGYASDDAIEYAYRMNPFMRPYDEDGEYNVKPGNFEALGTASNQFSDQVNPLLYNESELKESNNYRVLGNLYLEVRPLEGLSLKTTFSPNFNHVNTGQYIGDEVGNDPMGSYEAVNRFEWTWDNVLNYQVTKGDHSINAMGLYSMYAANRTEAYLESANPTKGTDWYNLGTGTIQDYSTEYSESTMISYAARLNYSFKGKYMITGTIRRDGSSKFGTDNKWGNFPSAALAWRLSEESFMSFDWLSNLKLRASYGITGNNSGIGNYDVETVGAGPNIYAFGSTAAYAYYPSGIVNTLLSWESSNELNLGFDFGFYKSRIYGTVDIYNKNSYELLYADKPLPPSTGGQELSDNVGSVSNKGIELSLTTVNVSTKDLTWKTSFTFAANKNKVTNLFGAESQIDTDDEVTASMFLDHPVNNIYGYNWTGIVSDRMMTVSDNAAAAAGGFTAGDQVSEAEYYYAIYGWSEGMPIIEDVNMDGSIDESNDKKILGSQDPAWTASITSSLNYKNWDFSFSIYTKQNYMVYSESLYENYNYAYRGWNKLNMDYYIPAGTLIDCDGVTSAGVAINPVYQEQTHYGSFPFVNATTENYGAGSLWYSKENYNLAAMVDASYWKVRNITLGYTFDKTFLDKYGLINLRLYMNVTNPFVFTKYAGFDPEWAGAQSQYDGPSTITYQFGVNLKF